LTTEGARNWGNRKKNRKNTIGVGQPMNTHTCGEGQWENPVLTQKDGRISGSEKIRLTGPAGDGKGTGGLLKETGSTQRNISIIGRNETSRKGGEQGGISQSAGRSKWPQRVPEVGGHLRDLVIKARIKTRMGGELQRA